MWIFTKYGFFSAVQNRDIKSEVIVRARFRKDMERLIEGPLQGWDLEIDDKTGTDYPFRIYLSKLHWRAMLAALAKDLDYPNFKAEAERRLEYPEIDALHSIWSTMRRAQENDQPGHLESVWFPGRKKGGLIVGEDPYWDDSDLEPDAPFGPDEADLLDIADKQEKEGEDSGGWALVNKDTGEYLFGKVMPSREKASALIGFYGVGESWEARKVKEKPNQLVGLGPFSPCELCNMFYEALFPDGFPSVEGILRSKGFGYEADQVKKAIEAYKAAKGGSDHE